MLKAIPWDIIGPVAAAVIIILIIVFSFILKFQKQSKPAVLPANPPKDINSTSRKTLCFKHEGEIAANMKAIEIFGGALKEANRNNSEQHGKIFDKMDDLKTTVITEIKKINGG
jgi:hypothetical protein